MARHLSPQAQQVLDALQRLSPEERTALLMQEVGGLANQIANTAPAATPTQRASASSALTQEVAERLITEQGGIFLGARQLINLAQLAHNRTIPAIPAEFSTAFLNAPHPLHPGTIGQHIILGYDTATEKWYCFEKDIVPGSRGLSGSEQDQLLFDQNGQPMIVEGLQYTSPTDYRPIKRLLDIVLRLEHRATDLPFYRTYGRTADTLGARFQGIPYDLAPSTAARRIVLGGSRLDGSRVDFCYGTNYVNDNLGLLAGWQVVTQPAGERGTGIDAIPVNTPQPHEPPREPARTRFKFVNDS